MNDRELLEMAAKAAGVKAQFSDNYGDFSIGEPYSNGEKRWNPLTDDGDALRLAVRLGMSMENLLITANWRITFFNEKKMKEESILDNDLKRAIVRAAAEIGRSM